MCQYELESILSIGKLGNVELNMHDFCDLHTDMLSVSVSCVDLDLGTCKSRVF